MIVPCCSQKPKRLIPTAPCEEKHRAPTDGRAVPHGSRPHLNPAHGTTTTEPLLPYMVASVCAYNNVCFASVARSTT